MKIENANNVDAGRDVGLADQAKEQARLGNFDEAALLVAGIQDAEVRQNTYYYLDEARHVAEGRRRAELDSSEREAGLGEGGVYEVPGLTEEDAERAEKSARSARERRESEGRA